MTNPQMRQLSRPQAYLLAAGAIALLAATILYLALPNKSPSARTGESVQSPPASSDPSVSGEKIENQQLSLEKIAGLSGEQTVGLLSRMTAAERAELGQRLTTLAPGALNNDKIASFFRAWAKFDARAAFQMALNFKHTSQTRSALTSVLEGAEPKDASNLIDGLMNLPPGKISAETAQELLQTGLSKWASVDAASAARFLDNYTGDIAPSAWQAVAESWGMVDPASALAWANKQPDAVIKEKQMWGAMRAWVKIDLPAAAEYARAHLDGTLASEKFVSLAANQIAVNDPKAAMAYIETLPGGSVKQSAQMLVAAGWAHNDPAAAAAWVSSLPAEAQSEAASLVVMAWATQDPQAAVSWIKTLEGTARDSAISAYSQNLARLDPGTALQWAQSIESANTRTVTVELLLRQWLQCDPTRAREWINRSDLSDAEKLRVLPSQPSK